VDLAGVLVSNIGCNGGARGLAMETDFVGAAPPAVAGFLSDFRADLSAPLSEDLAPDLSVDLTADLTAALAAPLTAALAEGVSEVLAAALLPELLIAESGDAGRGRKWTSGNVAGCVSGDVTVP
jgi:predicted naringenin-chalcone synthase